MICDYCLHRMPVDVCKYKDEYKALTENNGHGCFDIKCRAFIDARKYEADEYKEAEKKVLVVCRELSKTHKTLAPILVAEAYYGEKVDARSTEYNFVANRMKALARRGALVSVGKGKWVLKS